MSASNKKIPRPQDAPEWWDCVWRRDACGKDECPLCGRVNRQRQKHLERGEDPDSIEAALEDVEENFREVKGMIEADAEKLGVDLDEVKENAEAEIEEEVFRPEETELGKRVRDWRVNVQEFTRTGHEEGAAWPHTDSGRSLFWYANTLLVKTYRQLGSRTGEDEYVDLDYRYTRYVLQECLDILARSLQELEEMDPDRKSRFRMIALHLDGFRDEILNI